MSSLKGPDRLFSTNELRKLLLVWQICAQDPLKCLRCAGTSPGDSAAPKPASEEWAEELVAMQAIYGDSVQILEEKVVRLSLEDVQLSLDLRPPTEGNYPLVPLRPAVR